MNVIIKEYAQEALDTGFRVFIAENGQYGFFTDSLGTKVISFGTEYGGIKLSGNYKTDQPSQCGTGWGITPYYNPTDAFNQYPPTWATQRSKWSYTTLEQHLKTYQKSSRYVELFKES